MRLIKLSYSLRSSTLIETIIAFVLISILSAIFFSFLNGIIRNRRNTEIKLNAAIQTENILNKTISSKEFTDKEYTFDDFTINVNVEESQTKKSYYIITVKCMQQNNVIILKRTSIISPQIIEYETN